MTTIKSGRRMEKNENAKSHRKNLPLVSELNGLTVTLAFAFQEVISSVKLSIGRISNIIILTKNKRNKNRANVTKT